jgi:hypothetical protein
MVRKSLVLASANPVPREEVEEEVERVGDEAERVKSASVAVVRVRSLAGPNPVPSVDVEGRIR